MADDLGGRLLRAGLLTRDQLADALATAPLHGAALVRELTALGVPDDALAGFFLSEGFGPLMDPEDLAAADPGAVARLPAALAVDFFALPVRASPAGLVVAMVAPSDRHVVDEIKRVTAGDVLPTVARATDLVEALRRAHPSEPIPSSSPPHETLESEPPVLELVRRRPRADGSAPRDDARGDDAPDDTRDHDDSHDDARLERDADGADDAAAEEDAPVPLVRHKPYPTPAVGSARPAMVPERRAVARAFGRPEGAKAKLPAAPLSKPRDRNVPTADYEIPKESDAPPPAPASVPASTKEPANDGLSDLPPASDPMPSSVVSLAPDEAAPKASIIPRDHERWDLDPAPAASAPAPPPRSMRPRGSARPASAFPPARERPPEIGTALSSIRTSRDRDEVVRLACEAAVTVCTAAVFLTLRKDVLKGWDGLGGSLSRDAVRNLWLPTKSASTFSRVVATRSPHAGPYGDAVADEVFRAAVGSRGGELAVQPVSVAERLIGVLAADDVRGAFGHQRIEILAQAVGEAFKRIIVGGKAG